MKRHTQQTDKQALGQYLTTKATEILAGFESYVQGKNVIDCCAGYGDLLTWAEKHGAASTKGYDIDFSTGYEQRDSLMNPPNFAGKFVITNPPYLCRNKAKKQYAEIYDKYKQNDLYKCHLVSLIEQGCTEGIEILPANFLCESKSSMRSVFFTAYEIIEAKYWAEPIFEDATTGIVAFYFKAREKADTIFPITMFPENKRHIINLKSQYGYLYGDEFFDYINSTKMEFDIQKTIKGDAPPNTHFVFSLMDKNKVPQGLTYNEGEPIYSDPKAFTTYQLTMDIDMTEEFQRKIVAQFNEKLSYWRNKYHGLFLSNYLGANQKILSVSYCNKLLTKLIEENMELTPFWKLT